MNETMMLGNFGCYLEENRVFSFQLGTDPVRPFGSDSSISLRPTWLNVRGYNVLARGVGNKQCEDIETGIKQNRLLPRLISKQCTMLYGHGPAMYIKTITPEGKVQRKWMQDSRVMNWLERWEFNGMEMSYIDFALAVIKNYYSFGDFFSKYRLSKGSAIGLAPLAGMECMENKQCRLATTRTDVATGLVEYKDFRYIAVGNWNYGAAVYKVYPRFDLRDISTYQYAAIGHHRAKSIGEYYGCNETFEGTKPYIRGANETPEYINSFLRNSLAAKIHIIIPNAWLNSKRIQITSLCNENKKRKSDKKELFTYENIEIGTEYSEAVLIKYVNQEIRKLSNYLSGKENQGKAYASFSFKTGDKEEERWRIETIDLKYKEYISSLIEYDKRADEVILSAVGLDSSISSVSKDGIISKSGADVYYNYILYLLSLNPDDEKCSEPFNIALRLNFPDLYAQGYRFGYYREIPSRQEEVSLKDRLSTQKP